MIKVEFIYPYTIVKENDLYGITDNIGNLVVPCIMDNIDNNKDDDIGLGNWVDFSCVPIVKSGKYGFFTRNGKFIEPVYEAYVIDPCGGNIHVKTDDGYGVFASPEYIFEEIPAQYSLYAEIYPEDFDESLFEDEDTL
jgi:hypothetical protein